MQVDAVDIKRDADGSINDSDAVRCFESRVERMPDGSMGTPAPEQVS